MNTTNYFTAFELLPEFHGVEKHHVYSSYFEWLKYVHLDENNDGVIDEYDYELYLTKELDHGRVVNCH